MNLWRRGPARRSPPPASVQWLVVGLGNPGERYSDTRHNLGRRALLRFAERHSAVLDQAKHHARFGLCTVCGQRHCLATPTTFMNDSGAAVGPLSRFFKVPAHRVLLAFDDLDLAPGTVRVRPGGGAGGHNGVASVLASLGTADVPRVRLGIGRPPPGWDPADYVLSRIPEAEGPEIESVVVSGSQAIEAVLCDGLEAAMNRCN